MHKVHFLDVTVSIAAGVIETGLYVEPTDSHQYLLSSFCHPFLLQKGYAIEPGTKT